MDCKVCEHYAACTRLITESEELIPCELFSDPAKVVRIPCAVGDVVYSKVAERTEGFVVTKVEVVNTPGGMKCSFLSDNGEYPMLFTSDSIGKTVFLSREGCENATGVGMQ